VLLSVSLRRSDIIIKCDYFIFSNIITLLPYNTLYVLLFMHDIK
jgi:hypothetical protein